MKKYFYILVLLCITYFLVKPHISTVTSSDEKDTNIEVTIDESKSTTEIMTAVDKQGNEYQYISLAWIADFYGVELEEASQNQVSVKMKDQTYLFDNKSLAILKDNQLLSKSSMLIDNELIYIAEDFIQKEMPITIVNEKIVEKIEVPILMYHTVNDRENDTINTQPANFKEQMQAIKNAGYTTITPFDLENYYFNGQALPDKPILITFDDGYKDNYLNAYPILEELQMKATIFAIVSRIEEQDGVTDYPNEIPKLSWENIEEMKDLITIQNHTWDLHWLVESKGALATPIVKSNNEIESLEEYRARINEDINRAQAKLEQKLGYSSVMFSYPYGQYNETVLDVLKENDVRFGVTVAKGSNYHYKSLLELKRFTVNGNSTGEQLLQQISQF